MFFRVNYLISLFLLRGSKQNLQLCWKHQFDNPLSKKEYLKSFFVYTELFQICMNTWMGELMLKNDFFGHRKSARIVSSKSKKYNKIIVVQSLREFLAFKIEKEKWNNFREFSFKKLIILPYLFFF